MKTLGEFYKERILPRKDLISRELPDNSDEVRIEKDLFGWKLYSDENFIECRSEEEARYLKVFFDAGMTSVGVPNDDEYIKSILDELEGLKMKIDEIGNSYLETVLDRKTRERVKQEVFMEITK